MSCGRKLVGAFDRCQENRLTESDSRAFGINDGRWCESRGRPIFVTRGGFPVLAVCFWVLDFRPGARYNTANRGEKNTADLMVENRIMLVSGICLASPVVILAQSRRSASSNGQESIETVWGAYPADWR